ncbi:MAG: galactokinase [Spirochaetaceae bacterium]|jgi:galactokinase|nr:galactokinase [Spirochaetaceae bacterium]
MQDLGVLHRGEYSLGDDQTLPIAVGEAPGIIHLLGEHGYIDNNTRQPKAGLFLSAAISRRVLIHVSPRKDGSLRFYQAERGDRKRSTLNNLRYKREDRWANHVKAAIYLFHTLGKVDRGLNFTISQNIPKNSGLASQAALYMASVMALKGLYKVSLNDTELLHLIERTREEFYNRVPKMADFQAMLGARKDTFVIVDEINRSVKHLPNPIKGCKILLIDTKCPRQGVDEEMEHRRQELNRGLEILSAHKRGRTFRDIASEGGLGSAVHLPEEIRRCCLYVTQELKRVADVEKALKAGDVSTFSRIVYHSHEDLRDLYEVSCPEIDWMVKRAQETEGVLCARLNGMGFGGCTFTILKNDAIERYKNHLEDYERIFGFHYIDFTFEIETGARVITRSHQ